MFASELLIDGYKGFSELKRLITQVLVRGVEQPGSSPTATFKATTLWRLHVHLQCDTTLEITRAFTV